MRPSQGGGNRPQNWHINCNRKLKDGHNTEDNVGSTGEQLNRQNSEVVMLTLALLVTVAPNEGIHSPIP